jgi:hypothetical protein
MAQIVLDQVDKVYAGGVQAVAELSLDIADGEGKTLWTARASARSRISAGSPVELSVDTGNLHFFDPGTGLTIGSKGSVNPAS